MTNQTVTRQRKERLLLVDDDTELCLLLEEYLGSEHFTVESVNDGELGLAKACSGEHDIVILDVMLPSLNGLEILRQVRSHSGLPVLLLTARGDEVDRIVGLEMGADDYLPKPFSPRELAARIRAILRRTNGKPVGGQGSVIKGKVRVDNICLDPGTRIVTLSDRPIELTSVEFDLLEILLRSAGTVVTREQLCRQALDRDLSPIDRSVDMHISRLRKKIETEPECRGIIKTIRGVGYLYAHTSDDG